MKKTFSLEIKEPCHEKISNMKQNASGFFCNSCVKNVVDLSTKTNTEIARFINQNKNNSSICARLKTSQLQQEFEINELSRTATIKYAIAVAATVLLTSPVLAQEHNLPLTTINCPKPNPKVVEKIAYKNPESKVIFITIEGIILDENTKKALLKKQFPELTIYFNGAKNTIKINAKTGCFSVPISIDENTKEIYFSLRSGDLYYSNNIIIDTKTLKNNVFKTSINIAFAAVIKACGNTPRKDAETESTSTETWISPAMIAAYCELHAQGFAVSSEAWLNGELVGGCYGVKIGRMFYGESMFHTQTDASKVAFVNLVNYLKNQQVELIDCQMKTPLLTSFGGREISRISFSQAMQKLIHF